MTQGVSINLYNKDTGDFIKLGEKQGPGDVKVPEDPKLLAEFLSFCLMYEGDRLIACSEETWTSHAENPANRVAESRILTRLKDMEDHWKMREKHLGALEQRDKRSGDDVSLKRVQTKLGVLRGVRFELCRVINDFDKGEGP